MRYGAVVLNRCAAQTQVSLIVHILTTNLRNFSLFRSWRVLG
jgi:hypothetical protein